MSVFMVERDLKGITMDALGAAQQAAISQGKLMTAAGTPVRYIRSTFAPEDGRLLLPVRRQHGGRRQETQR